MTDRIQQLYFVNHYYPDKSKGWMAVKYADSPETAVKLWKRGFLNHPHGTVRVFVCAKNVQRDNHRIEYTRSGEQLLEVEV
jgi:hypothetical protein